jgi:hypothetical protein
LFDHVVILINILQNNSRLVTFIIFCSLILLLLLLLLLLLSSMFIRSRSRSDGLSEAIVAHDDGICPCPKKLTFCYPDATLLSMKH